jgi:hypothetical protein
MVFTHHQQYGGRKQVAMNRKRRPLYPQKQTCAVQLAMSAMGQ